MLDRRENVIEMWVLVEFVEVAVSIYVDATALVCVCVSSDVVCALWICCLKLTHLTFSHAQSTEFVFDFRLHRNRTHTNTE